MNVYLIKASAPGPFKEYKKAMGAPPQNIYSVAAATPEGVGIDMCDETIGMKPKLNTKADIVALFPHTPDALHAYKLADKYRARGKTVVLGGLHPSFLPDEAAEHANAVMIGEAEGIWEELIADYENQTLKKLYRREAPVDLADDEELLQAAADSGYHWLLIGIETPSQAKLNDSGKSFVDPDTIRDKISRFHAHGIHITSSMIFGFDTHT